MPGTGVPVFVFMGHALGGTHRQVITNTGIGSTKCCGITSQGHHPRLGAAAKASWRKRSAEGWEERAGAAGRSRVPGRGTARGRSGAEPPHCT